VEKPDTSKTLHRNRANMVKADSENVCLQGRIDYNEVERQERYVSSTTHDKQLVVLQLETETSKAKIFIN